MMWGISRWSWSAILVTAVVFVLFPQIDLMFTGLFYRQGEGFYLGSLPWVEFFYDFGPQIVVVLALAVLVVLLTALIRKKRIFNVDTVVWLYFVLVMLVGPTLIVNVILKENWGRYRPNQVTEFGGTQAFSPALIRTGNDEGFSFVSGHSATGFSLLAIALVLARHRRVVFTAALFYGSIIGLSRIMQGGHFLSDVVFSFIFVYLTAKILHHLLFEYEPGIRLVRKLGLSQS